MNTTDNVKIILDFGNGNLDVSRFLLAKTLQIKDNFCNDKYGSAMNSASFTLIKDDVFYNLLRDSENDVSVLIIDCNGTVIFRGILDPVFSDSWREPNELGKIQIEAVDLSSKLDVAIQAGISWPAIVGDEPYRIFRRSEPEKSILFLLLRMAAMQSLISPYAPDIDIAIKQFTLNANSSNVMAEIDTLLIEYGWCLNTLPDGTFTWLQTAKDKLSEIPVIGPKDIIADGFKVEKKYDIHDGVCVSWPKTKIFDDTVVYRGNLPIGDSSNPTPGEAIAAGDYWPEDSDINEVWMDFGENFLDLPYLSGSTRRKNSDIDLISSSGWYIKDIKDNGINIDPISTEHPVIYEPLRARLRYKNTSGSPQKLRWTEIWAKALVRDQLVRSFFPESADNSDEYKARFIYDDASAERLARIRWMHLYTGCWKVSFRSTKRFEPGDFLHLDQMDRFSSNILITSRARTYDFTGIYSYIAVTTEPISDVSVRRTASGFSGRPRLAVDGKSYYLHIAYADSADGSIGFSTTYTEGKRYLGQYTGFSEKAPLDHSLYTWAKFKGETGLPGGKGDPGKDGKGISSLVEHYLASDASSGITLSSSGWTTAMQAMTAQKRNLWSYTHITYTDGTSTDTVPCIIGVYGDPGTDAVTVDISNSVMQISVNASGKAVSSTSFNVTFKGWQGHASKPCTASVGALPQGMTATIGTDTVTLTVAKDSTLGNDIAGEVEINITCCGLVFAKKTSWVKALDATQIQQDIQALTESKNDHEARLTAVKVTADNANNKATANETNIVATAERLNSTVTRLTTAEGNISNAKSQINQQASEISLKVTAVQNGTEISGAKLEISSAEGGMIKLDADKVIAPGTISADKLKANILDIVNILLGEGGSIHSGIYDSKGNKTSSGKGVFIGANGVSKMTGLILDDGTIQSDAIDTVNEEEFEDLVTAKPFPSAKDCSYPNNQLAAWVKSELTANIYKAASGSYGSDTVTGLMNIVSSADVSISSGRTNSAVIKTFTTPAGYPTSIRIQASPISWYEEWEESSGSWVCISTTSGDTSPFPSSSNPPANPQPGDTYTSVTFYSNHWVEKVYEYQVTTTTHTSDGNYNLKVTVNGVVKHDTNQSYNQILSLSPASTIVIEYSGNANGYNDEGSWDVSYNNYRYYGKKLVYFNASNNAVTISETGMANTALSITVDGATITGGNGKTSWANLTPCSLFQGVLQKGAQLTNLTASLADDIISFSAQPYGESEVLITTAKSIMVEEALLSIIRADGTSYSTYGKWYTSWSLSNCTPIKKETGVYVRTLLPKGGDKTGKIGADGKFFEKAYINEITSNKVWGAVVNPG